ncbi:rhomboid-like protein [Streptomyces sp. Ac-502]|uniref:rhomboid-like protein n=1 Tax=Streptomyces sp. Ac-502 TaxID=3342801 RepID=UPI0038623D2C
MRPGLPSSPVDRGTAWVRSAPGTHTWLLTVGAAHITATLAGQELVLLAIEGHRLPRSMSHVVDICVS